MTAKVKDDTSAITKVVFRFNDGSAFRRIATMTTSTPAGQAGTYVYKWDTTQWKYGPGYGPIRVEFTDSGCNTTVADSAVSYGLNLPPQSDIFWHAGCNEPPVGGGCIPGDEWLVCGNLCFDIWGYPYGSNELQDGSPDDISQIAYSIDEGAWRLYDIPADSVNPVPVCIDTTSLSEGPHNLKVRVADLCGIQGFKDIFGRTEWTFEVYNQGPLPAITSPPAGDIEMGGPVRLAATITNERAPDPVTRVEFYLDSAPGNLAPNGTLIGTAISPNESGEWEFVWDAEAGLGDHTITAWAFYDGCCNQFRKSDMVSINIICSTGPLPDITSPPPGTLERSNSTRLAALITDEFPGVPVTSVEFYLDSDPGNPAPNGTLIGTVLSPDLNNEWVSTWDSSGTALGGHTITAWAYFSGCSHPYGRSLPVSINITAPVVPPPEIATGSGPGDAQMWSEDKHTQFWPAEGTAEGYLLYRGTLSQLASLQNGSIDSCARYDGISESVDLSSDDPSSEAGRLYWYLVTAYNSGGEGPAGNGRIVNSSGMCGSFFLPSSVNWQGINALMPINLYWAASAVLNGKIYVFGGTYDNSEKSSTLIYDITDDNWTTGADMPTGRYLASAAEVGGKIYVMGGRQLAASQGPVNVNECYDPATNAWTTKSAMPSAVRGHSATVVNGKVFVMGGNSVACTNAVRIYDPVTDLWSNGAGMPFSAAYGGAAYLSSTNRIYWVGGVKTGTPGAGNFVGKSASYNPVADVWDEATPGMTEETAYNTIYADESTGKIFAFSGKYWNSDQDAEWPSRVNQVLDASSNTWSSGIAHCPSPTGRSYSCGVAWNGRLYLVGGAQFNNSAVRIVDVYDPSSDEWEDPNPVFDDGNSDNPAVYNVHGKVYVVGGAYDGNVNQGAYEFDPSLPQIVKKAGAALVPRSAMASGLYGDRIVMADGYNGSGSILGTVEMYNPLADVFTSVSGTDPTPTGYAAGAVVNGSLYVFGGNDGSASSNKTRILDIAEGTWSTGPDIPVAIERAGAVAVKGKIYIAGGWDGSGDNEIHDELIIFDPATNTFSAGQVIPVPVMSPAVTSFGNLVIVDGGSEAYDSNGSTYFRPSSWLQIYDTSAGTWNSYPRPYGKRSGGCAVAGSTFYSLCGDDIAWATTRVDIASFSASGFTVTENGSREEMKR